MDIEYHVHAVLSNLPISTSKFEEFKQATLNDLVLKENTTCVRNGWLQVLSECSPTIKPYFQIKDELSIVDGILLKVDGVLVPSSMRYDMLKRIHERHVGVEKSKARARAVARTLIGGGGGAYSYIHVLPDEFLFKSNSNRSI